MAQQQAPPQQQQQQQQAPPQQQMPLQQVRRSRRRQLASVYQPVVACAARVKDGTQRIVFTFHFCNHAFFHVTSTSTVIATGNETPAPCALAEPAPAHLVPEETRQLHH